MTYQKRLIAVSVMCISATFSSFIYTKNLPIVLVHGLLADEYSMIPAEKHIHEFMPDVYVKSVDLGEGRLTSLCNMYNQVEWLKNELESDPNLAQGCIIIAHSQGGLVARYFIEKYNNPRVYVYISWGTPEVGIFGAPDKLDYRFGWLNYIKNHAHKFAYSYAMQRLISFAGYWKDSFFYDKYLSGSTFLPYLNNEIDHADAALFKENICNLCTMVVVQSTREEVVVPAASCHFCFYQIGLDTAIEHLSNTDWYKQDNLGIKTLAESGRLHFKFAHCTHADFQKDRYNFIENTLPYLYFEAP